MKYHYKEITINVPRDIYYPTDDSELMAEFMKKIKKKIQFKKLLEIGCGSGFLSILCAKLGAAVTSVDINEEAVLITKENAKRNSVHLKTFQSDIFKKINEKFDFIIFNPPYLPDNHEDYITKKYTETVDMQYLKKDVIKRFLAEYQKYLAKNGKAFMVASSVTAEKIPGRIISKKKIHWEELRIFQLV